MDDFVLSAFSGGMCEYRFDWENVRFSLGLDSGLFQSEDINQYVNVEMHQHPYYEWFFVTNGCMQLQTATETLELHRHDFVIIRPGLEHCVHFLEDGTTRYNFSFTFEGNGLDSTEDLLSQVQQLLAQAPCISGTGGQELADINRRLSQLCGTDRRAMICACFAEVITSVLDTVRAVGPSATLAKFLRDESISRRDRLEKLFTTYYMYDCTLDFVAECFGISGRQVNRIIRKEFNDTFHNRLSRTRILSARQLLDKTDFHIQEVAQWVGYTSLCGFYNAFKVECGCLPGDYRKRKH